MAREPDRVTTAPEPERQTPGQRDSIDDAFLGRVVDASFDPYVVLSTDATVLWVSGTCEELVGIPSDQLTGISVLDVIAPESRDQALQAFAEFTAPDRPNTGWTGPALTVKLRHAAGHRVSCRVLAVPSGDPDFDGLVLRLRRTESNDKLDAAIASLVQGDDITTTLARLLDFANEQMPYSIGTVGLGFDGTSFARVVADPRAPLFIDQDSLLPTDDPTLPWRQVLDGERATHLDTSDLAEPVRTIATQAGYPGVWAFALDQNPPHSDVLVFWRRATGPPGPHLNEGMERIIRLSQLALEGDRTRRLLERQANTDELTGLANRAMLYGELAAMSDEPPEAPFGILYCDLDDFKPVNDLLGHTMGDKVLQIAARRIAGQVRAGDVTARIGGDEFAVLCPTTTVDALGHLADRLVAAFEEPITVGTEEVALSISVGAALLDPADTPFDPTRVLDRADVALLQAKAGGKGRWHAVDGL